MYAVIRSGGKQYKVTQGERIRLGLLAADTGAPVQFDVLAVHDGKSLKVGTPLVESAKVTGTVLSRGRGRKITVFRFKRRKGFHKKKGHRQDYSEVLIEDVELEGKSVFPAKAEKPAPRAEETKGAEPAAQSAADKAADSAKEGD